MEPHFSDETITLYLGDCLQVMRKLPDSSVDAVVCDPPYGLEFMGSDWDRPWAVSPTNAVGYEGRDDLRLPSHRDARNANCRRCGGRQRGAKRCTCSSPQWDRSPAQDMVEYQLWCQGWAEDCLRLLKPGGHLLAFGGTRTHHRLACAIEDAGFEIRDSIAWLYGSGFPKSLDVSKAIDSHLGAEREVVGTAAGAGKHSGTALSGGELRPQYEATTPATDEAKDWAGWGTALKPANEPIVVARKPLIGTVASNVLAHGTGALNIDGCRIAWEDGDRSAQRKASGYSEAAKKALGSVVASENTTGFAGEVEGSDSSGGRWPPNVVLTHTADCREVGQRDVRTDTHYPAARPQNSHLMPGHHGQADLEERAPGTETVAAWDCAPGCPVAALDEQTGVLRSGKESAQGHLRNTDKTRSVYGRFEGQRAETGALYGDEGGASRFFPVFRYAAKASRAERNAGMDSLPERPILWSSGEANPGSVQSENTNRSARNFHPTVKPVELMRWLVRLVTPPGGLVLDPFLGSGTTAEACVAEGFACIGIEREPDYMAIALARLSKPIQIGLGF